MRRTAPRFKEADPLGGSEPYALSKAAAEFAVSAYRQSQASQLQAHRRALVTVRAGNIIGGGDWAADRLVPDAVRAFQGRKALVLRKPEAVRPWQFVLDALAGLLRLTEAACRDPKKFSGAWNFGPTERATTTVGEVADMLVRHWGSGALWTAAATPGIPETLHLEIDSGKAARELGWKPLWPLERALGETIKWYRSFYAGEDMSAASSRQIDDHCSGQ